MFRVQILHMRKCVNIYYTAFRTCRGDAWHHLWGVGPLNAAIVSIELEIAKELARLIETETGYEIVLLLNLHGWNKSNLCGFPDSKHFYF